MSELVIEVGYQVPPNAVYIRTSGDEIRVTVHPEPEAEVLATLRDDIVDATIDLSNTESEPAENSGDATSNAEVNPIDVTDARETKQPSVDD
jgi:hypothetical protein